MEEKKSLKDNITYSGSRMSLDGVRCWLERYSEESSSNKFSMYLGECKVEFVRSPEPVIHIPLKNLDKEFLAKFFLEEAELSILTEDKLYKEPVYITALSKGNSLKVFVLFKWVNYSIKDKFNTNELLTKLNEYAKE